MWNSFKGRYWLGGYQDDNATKSNEGWIWVTGEEMTWTNWDPHEPNDWGMTTRVEDNEEDYMAYWDWGLWNDASLLSNSISGYIIEYEPATQTHTNPIPSTFILFGSGFVGLVGIMRKFAK